MKTVKSSFEKAYLIVPNFNTSAIDETTVLYGGVGAILDSMTIVNLVFILEDEVFKNYGVKIKITTAEVLSEDSPPFLNVNNLVSFLETKINQDADRV